MLPAKVGCHQLILVAFTALLLLPGVPCYQKDAKQDMDGGSRNLALAAQDRNNSQSNTTSCSSSCSHNSTLNSTAPGRRLIDELSTDTIVADAAARLSTQLPSKYPSKGLIDVQSPLFSEEPGVLVPLAQGQSAVGDWLAAVEVTGSGTPMSDPMFVGTVFIPRDEAVERVYPLVRQCKLLGQPASAGYENETSSTLAWQLNALTVPGDVVKVEQMWPGRVLKTAGAGVLKVLNNRVDGIPARLQHWPSGVIFTVIESDLQSGSAVAHVIDRLIPAQALKQGQSGGMGEGRQYDSAMAVLKDPMHQLGRFAWFVDKAGLAGMMSNPGDALTVFAPDDKAVGTFLALLTPSARESLLSNASLTDQLVSSHLLLGMALGSKALESLLPGGRLRTSQGSLAVRSASMPLVSLNPPAGSVAVAEAGQLNTSPPATTNSEAISTVKVADSFLVGADLVGGKAVLHITDRVLVSPDLADVLGIPASQGYAPLGPAREPVESGAGPLQAARIGLSAAIALLVVLVL